MHDLSSHRVLVSKRAASGQRHGRAFSSRQQPRRPLPGGSHGGRHQRRQDRRCAVRPRGGSQVSWCGGGTRQRPTLRRGLGSRPPRLPCRWWSRPPRLRAKFCPAAVTDIFIGRDALAAAKTASVDPLLGELQIGEGGVFQVPGGILFAAADPGGLIAGRRCLCGPRAVPVERERRSSAGHRAHRQRAACGAEGLGQRGTDWADLPVFAARDPSRRVAGDRRCNSRGDSRGAGSG